RVLHLRALIVMHRERQHVSVLEPGVRWRACPDYRQGKSQGLQVSCRFWISFPGGVVQAAFRVLLSWQSASWRESNQRRRGAPTAHQWTCAQIALGTRSPRIMITRKVCPLAQGSQPISGCERRYWPGVSSGEQSSVIEPVSARLRRLRPAAAEAKDSRCEDRTTRVPGTAARSVDLFARSD